MSVITVEELRYGLTWKPKPKTSAWLERFINWHCDINPINATIAALAGEMRGGYKRQAKPEPWLTCLLLQLLYITI